MRADRIILAIVCDCTGSTLAHGACGNPLTVRTCEGFSPVGHLKIRSVPRQLEFFCVFVISGLRARFGAG